MEEQKIRIKLRPRKIDLEPKDIMNLSFLADGEIVEDPSGRHKPGTHFTISHGGIGAIKFPDIVFSAINPVEFFLYSAVKNLENIKLLEAEVGRDFVNINKLLLEEFQFCIFTIAALEAFINQIIPNEFEYNDGNKILSKKDIEDKWSLEDKIKKIVPKSLNVNISNDTKVWQSLKLLMNLRNDLTHLKTTYPVVSDFQSYQNLYKRLLDNNYEESYKTIQEVIKRIATGGEEFYSKQKYNGDKEERKSSWYEILRKGLRSITG